MKERTKMPPEIAAAVLVACRRRCCLCFALDADSSEKKGQIAHLDRDPSNNDLDNLVFLCLPHHNEYDSRPRQSKGFGRRELKKYWASLRAFVDANLPRTDEDIAAALTAALDRPAFRTPFNCESSLPRFRKAIGETISTLNTGITPEGQELPSKAMIHSPKIRRSLDAIVEALVALRASFDSLLSAGEIRQCGCGDPDCPVHMLSHRAIREMDTKRRAILQLARKLNQSFPEGFYDIE